MKIKGADQTGGGESATGAAQTGEEALAWAVSAGAAKQLVTDLRARARQRWRRRFGLGAAGVATVAMMWMLWPPADKISPRAAPPPAALVLAPERRVLGDGSVVELKPGAALTVSYSAGARRIALLRGEAHFEVMPDAARPFVVSVGGVEVRAVGTAFSVERGKSHVDVLVTKGRVAVMKAPGLSPQTPTPVAAGDRATAPETVALLDMGYGARIDLADDGKASAQVAVVNAAERDTRLAWRIARLQFTGTPLREAILMFNRHGARQLVLDPAIGDLQLSGVLRADDTDSLLLLLRNEFGVVAVPRGEGELVLRRP